MIHGLLQIQGMSLLIDGLRTHMQFRHLSIVLPAQYYTMLPFPGLEIEQTGAAIFDSDNRSWTYARERSRWLFLVHKALSEVTHLTDIRFIVPGHTIFTWNLDSNGRPQSTIAFDTPGTVAGETLFQWDD